ncbi:SRPBCC family protein [Natronoarchaeum mannanilyticum]|uniref:SRPBCC family protein n=1 Tax=Natronoarchaeum mannanilyticum TaxID=926360 RepID=A0AAV3TDN0_9EURY
MSTDVYLPPEEIYEFLEDFPGYADYSKYLKEVRSDGTGEEGTRYDLEFAWWKLNYTARSEVTDTDPPERIDWRIVKDVDAGGYWQVEPRPEAAPPDRETASRVRFVVEFDPDSANAGALDLPALVSIGWVIDKIRPKVLEEAERVVERIVADLEGERRDVELRVHEQPSSV